MLFNDLKHKLRIVRNNRKSFYVTVPLDENVGFQNVKVNVDAYIIETFNYSDNTLSIETLVTSTNDYCYSGDIRGAFEATLVIDNIKNNKNLIIPEKTYYSTSTYNFTGKTMFNNISYRKAQKINISLYGNWIVRTGNGNHALTYPTILGILFPRKYNHTFKIK